jgi:hypothetical protein
MQQLLEDKFMKKICTVGLAFILFFTVISTSYAIPTENEYALASTMNKTSNSSFLFLDDKSIIENYTWAFMRYDHYEPSLNFEKIDIPTPTVGSILVPANMMSEEICKTALQIYHDSKLETFHALDEYDCKCMIHTMDAFFKTTDEWNTDSSFNYRKESAVEMNALGDICFKADLVGECYAQASFNTAVLRLCGFSAEEVFTIAIQGESGGHAVNIVMVDDEWYVFDSTFAPYVRKGMRDSVIFPIYYRSPITDYIILLENDKYLINFGTLFSEYIPTMKDPYNNMDADCLTDIIGNIRPIFNYSYLGKTKWNISDFIEQASPHPLMKTVEIPYTVKDAVGNNLIEKTDSLVALIKNFVSNQLDYEVINQYDKSRYALGYLDVEYPQVYAKAAKLAAWTSKFGIILDLSIAKMDIYLTLVWLQSTIRTKQIVPNNCIAYPDLLYIRHAGSTIDKAILAYGTLCNMKKDTDFWSADDLYVLITDDYKGYLAVNLNKDWKYLSFEKGILLSDTPPPNVTMVFNEIESTDTWEK